MAITQENLIRKQYLIRESQLAKIQELAITLGVSATQIVRSAIEAYNPHQFSINDEDMDLSELIELANDKVQEAITLTQQTQQEIQQFRAELGN